MIRLHVQPEVPPLTWDEFVADKPCYSIALDGFVKGGPRYDDKGPHRNLNHHEGVDRMATRATCGQVLVDIRQGLFERYRYEHGAFAHVYVNDCDEDVCTSWFLLNNHHLVQPTMNPLINRLVHMEDMLDATAGAYPLPKDLPLLRELAWVYEPYRRFRSSGGLAGRDPAAFRSVITDVCGRIQSHITGHGKEVPVDTRYERIREGTGWVMVNEVGAQARTGMFADGVRAFVAVQERPEGWAYTIGRMSEYVPFDVPALLKRLDHAEAAKLRKIMGKEAFEASDYDFWGGGSTIGGSPRILGSKQSPDEVFEVIEEGLRNLHAQ